MRVFIEDGEQILSVNLSTCGSNLYQVTARIQRENLTYNKTAEFKDLKKARRKQLLWNKIMDNQQVERKS